VHVQVGNVHIQRIRNLAWLATDLNLANDLFEHALFLFHANRLTHQVQRHSHFNLLSLNKPGEIRVNQTTLNRIDLSIVKHHFTCTSALDVDRENCISSRFRTKDRSKLAGRSDGSNCLCATAVNCNGHHAIAPRASRIVFAATLTQLCLHLVIFFLRHEFSLQTFSDKPIADFQLPIANFESAIGNRKLAINWSLMVFV
jgi:hypothetical protein